MKRNVWRPSATHTRARWWFAHRLVPAVLITVVSGLLLYLLMQPFFHPRTYLLLAEATYPDALIPPHVLPAEDLVSLPPGQVELLGNETGKSATGKGAPGRREITSPAALDDILDQLDSGEFSNRDVLMMWIGAQTVASGDQIALLCGDFDPSDIQTGRYPFSQLLDRVGRCPARTKLILLDAGRTAHDPRLGVFAGCSLSRIRQLVGATKDPTLWVMLSHSELQKSHALGGSPRSAFAGFVAEGLQGLADRDEDRFIHLGELYHYVHGRLADWASRQTNGRSSQTPMLIWGGGRLTSTTPFPLLLPVAPRKDTDDTQQIAGGGQSRPSTRRLHPAMRSPRLSVGHAVSPSLPSYRPVEFAVEAAELASDEAEANSQRQGHPPKETESPPAPVDESLTNGVPADVAAEEEPTSATATELWAGVWSLHDRLASSSELRPIDDAPHLWRALEHRLLSLEAAFQSGDPQSDAIRMTVLRRLAGQLGDLAEGRPPQRYQKHDVIPELAAWLQPIALDVTPHSLAMAERADSQGGSPVGTELATVAKRLDGLIADGDRAEYHKWIAELPPEFDQYIECRLARILASRNDLAWSNVQLVLRACRRAEAVAAETLDSGGWTRSRIEQADRLRLAAERSLLGSVRPEDASKAVFMLRRAIAQYDQAAAWNRDAVAVQRLANEAMFCLPDYLHWSIVSLAGTESTAPDELSQLLDSLARAFELLDRPAVEKLSSLRRVRRQLELTTDKLQQRISEPDGPLSATDRAENRDRLPRLRQLAGLYGVSVRLLYGDLPNSDERAEAVAAAAARFTNSDTGTGDLWEACAQLGKALRDYYRNVPAVVERLSAENQGLSDPASRTEKIGKLRLGRRLLYVVHPWDVARVEHANPTQLLRRAGLYDFLVWQQRRLIIALDDAPSVERPHLAAAAVAYRQAAIVIPQQPPVAAAEVPLIEIEAPQHVALDAEPDRELPLTVTNRHQRPVDVWLFADYDPQVLQMLSRDGHALYGETQLRLSPPPSASQVDAASQVSGAINRPNLDALEPTFRLLRPGETRAVWVNLRRKTLLGADARIVVRAISRSDYVRHDLTAELARRASVDLVVEGIADGWQSSDSGLTLYPLPNRTTEYKFYLVNSSSEAREVDFEILRKDDAAPASAANGELSAATADAYLAKIGASHRVLKVEKLTVPPGGRRVAIDLAEPSGEKQQKQAEQAKSPPEQKPPLSRFLLAVITDRVTGRRTIEQIEILVQRPARYVRPRVEYDPKRRRVEILVKAAKGSAIPREGVWITCEGEPLPDGEPHRSQAATLKPPATEAILRLDVPPDAGPIFPILVNVDGFKRAFRFEVPTNVTSPTLVPQSSRVDVRILEPNARTAYGPGSTEVAAALEVDVPHGLLLNGTSRVEIGIDIDRDRELEREESLLLTSDRQNELFLDRLGRDGTFAIGTRVDDLHVVLSRPRLEAARANLIARLILPGKEVWSDPVELIFDGEAPRMSRLQLLPGPTVSSGTELEVSVLASDENLAGVAKVEAAVDLLRQGKFLDDPPPVPGSLQPDGRWVVKVPTEGLGPGVYTVLVRVTDRLGNVSDYRKATVEVISKQAAANEKATLNRVDGRAVYGRLAKAPVEGASIRLVAAGKEKQYEATTDKDGRFTFAQVLPGEYGLAAEGLVGGNRRTGQTDVKVPPPPAVVEPIELILGPPR